MEMQYFTAADDEMPQYEKLREYRWKYYTDILRFKKEDLKWHKHENLVFYAKEAYDIEFKFPFGFKELEGVHARGDYDLSQHSKYSGQDLSYNDPASGQKYIPHIIESSVGVGRTVLAALCSAYTEEKVGDDERVVLKLPAILAPVKVAVFPLLKNKPELVSKAKETFDSIKSLYSCEFDDNGNIGKRYRRQDEIGTPLCVTIDFQTLEDNTITVRNRDTMEQSRVPLAELLQFTADSLALM
jgi:glycyl-tRNA synthetase